VRSLNEACAWQRTTIHSNSVELHCRTPTDSRSGHGLVAIITTDDGGVRSSDGAKWRERVARALQQSYCRRSLTLRQFDTVSAPVTPVGIQNAGLEKAGHKISSNFDRQEEVHFAIKTVRKIFVTRRLLSRLLTREWIVLIVFGKYRVNLSYYLVSASEMIYIVSGWELNSTYSLNLNVDQLVGL